MIKVWIYSNHLKHLEVIKKLAHYQINLLKTKFQTNHWLYLISYHDYLKLIQFNQELFQIVTYTGFPKVKNYLKQNKIRLITFIIGLFGIWFLSQIIVEVEIIHVSAPIRTLVREELAVYGVKRLTFKKSFKKLKKIKDKILLTHKSTLEWMEIERRGMKYIVRVETRIIPLPVKHPHYCHVISQKNGIVKKLAVTNGNSLVKMGSYIQKGDILISGDLPTEEVIHTCAQGQVLAEVWYTINVELPLTYNKIKETGRMRYNLLVKHHHHKYQLLKSRVNPKKTTNYSWFKILGYHFYWQKEKEVTNYQGHYTPEEALEMAKIKAIANLKKRLSPNSRVLDQKVLKKSLINSKMNLELFVTVEEEVGRTQIIE